MKKITERWFKSMGIGLMAVCLVGGAAAQELDNNSFSTPLDLEYDQVPTESGSGSDVESEIDDILDM